MLLAYSYQKRNSNFPVYRNPLISLVYLSFMWIWWSFFCCLCGFFCGFVFYLVAFGTNFWPVNFWRIFKRIRATHLPADGYTNTEEIIQFYMHNWTYQFKLALWFHLGAQILLCELILTWICRLSWQYNFKTKALAVPWDYWKLLTESNISSSTSKKKKKKETQNAAIFHIKFKIITQLWIIQEQ